MVPVGRADQNWVMTMSEPAIVDLQPATVAVIRATIPMNSIRDFYDRGFGEVAGVLAAQGVAPSGPALGIYWGVPTDTIELACGFPITRPITVEGRVTMEELPTGRAAQAVHVGPYEGLSDTYAQLADWVAAQGRSLGAMMWESYETEPTPEADPESMRTRITWPLA
jgi:effector-binding domain-containing protein